MEVEGGALDVRGGPAVVVDDRHPVAALQHLGGLHEVRAVGVHHDKKGPRLQPQEGLLLVHKGPGVLRQLPQLRQRLLLLQQRLLLQIHQTPPRKPLPARSAQVQITL